MTYHLTNRHTGRDLAQTFATPQAAAEFLAAQSLAGTLDHNDFDITGRAS